MKALLYVQHLSGIGHFVRMYEIARALAQAGHEVHLVDGGRSVPRRPAPVTLVPLPRIQRQDGSIAPRDVMPARRRLLADAVDRIEPDIVLIEHFPFSKWSLCGEVQALLEHAGDARIYCSVRDIVPTRSDTGTPAQVASFLRDHVNGVLVHADPRFCRFEADLPVPVIHTGYVSEKPQGRARGTGRIVASAGGAGNEALRAACEALPGEVVVFGSLLDGFAPDFLDWMNGADLSISQAGYNTCMNVLETRTRAILVPDPATSDQPRRAHLLADRGLATIVDIGDLGRLGDAVEVALSAPRPDHDIDLDGAAATARFLAQGQARFS